MIDGVTDYAIFTVSPTGNVETWTRGAEHTFGYTADEIVGRHFDVLFTANDRADGAPRLELTFTDAERRRDIDRWHVRKDGSRFWCTNTVQPLRDDAGRVTAFTKILRDTTDRHEATEALSQSEARLSLLVEELRHEVYHDALTGLPNRILFVEHVRRTIAHSQRLPQSYFAVLFLDLDRFKLVNDSLGHAFADQALIQISERLQSSLRDEDIVARIGGDEFAILVSDLHEPGEAVAFAERLHVTLAAPFVIEGQEIFASMSVGVVIGGAASVTPEQLLRDADTAMYAAKTRGRANHVVFDTKMHQNDVALNRLQTDLLYAVKRDELRIAYQPIVALADGHIVGFEALVRWDHPSRGIILPEAFMTAAEGTGLVIGIDRWVLREACREISDWNGQHATEEPLALSVNFSSKQFLHDDLVEHIERVLVQTGLPACLLKIEITESVLIERSPAIDAILKALRDLGVEIHIDDFGTGYASLSYLRYLPVNVLKIDRRFVHTMLDDVESFEIVRSIVTLSANLRLQAMAEGVETSAELAALRRLNCRYGQGYFFSPALPWSAASALATHKLPYVLS